ncbi:MAG: DUF333 domain-containing protein [Candidatus ainarchaeum sp.]|nr:DUF333 domain-containing protein [Candidatus ainarchaeum sp.]
MIRILALCVFSAFLLLAGCIGPGGLNNQTNNNQTNNTQIPNPASVYCENNSGVLEIKTDSTGAQYGICKLPGGVECEEWAFFRGECNATNPTYCAENSDCACGVHKTTRQCFYGNKDYVDVSQQCPDFCNGIAAHLQIKCVQNRCLQVRIVKDFAECASLDDSVIMESYPRQCRTVDGITFVEEVPACENLCGDGTCQEVVCMAIGCPCAETEESCPADCAESLG